MDESLGTMRCPEGALISYDYKKVDDTKQCSEVGPVFQADAVTLIVRCPTHKDVLCNARAWQAHIQPAPKSA